MIRFIDLTRIYWSEEDVRLTPSHKCCAFLNTVDDHFIKCDTCHVFTSVEDIMTIASDDYRARCLALVPKDFWTSRP